MAINEWVETAKPWAKARSMIRVERTRIQGEKESVDVAWYLSSHELNSERVARAVRQHWGIENKLHWRLDVIFNEDRYRSNCCATNMAMIKRFCMNLLKTHDGSKRTMKARMMAAAIDDGYRSKCFNLPNYH